MRASDAPDRIETHEVDTCAHCQASLAGIEVAGYAERQVCDIPASRRAGTVHRAEVKIGPGGSGPHTGDVPVGVTQAVQYGATVQTWAPSCTTHHHLAVERPAQIFDDLVHQPGSDAPGWKAAEE